MATAEARKALKRRRLLDFAGSRNWVEKRLWPQRRPQTRKTCFSLLCMVSCKKIKYPGVAYRSGTCFGSKLRLVRLQSLGPNNDNPNYIIQVGNVFGFIISIDNVIWRTRAGETFLPLYFAFSIVIILLLNKSEFVNHFSQKCWNCLLFKAFGCFSALNFPCFFPCRKRTRESLIAPCPAVSRHRA